MRTRLQINYTYHNLFLYSRFQAYLYIAYDMQYLYTNCSCQLLNVDHYVKQWLQIKMKNSYKHYY